MKGLCFLSVLVVAVCSQEHFIDVRELVKETLEAIKEAPTLMDTQNNSTVSPKAVGTGTKTTTSSAVPAADVPVMESKMSGSANSVYKTLLKLPADIMSRLALDAGFVEPAKKKSPELEGKSMVLEDPKKTTEVEKTSEAGASSFKTLEDIQLEALKKQNEKPTPTRPEENKDLFSIKELIDAARNAFREAQTQNQKKDGTPTMPPLAPLPAPLVLPGMPAVPMPKSEVVFRPIVKDGNTVYEQVVLQTMPDGSTKVVSQNVFQQLPQIEPKQKPVEVKAVKKSVAEFVAPTFPPMVNIFDQFTSTPSTTTTDAVSTSTETPKKSTTPSPSEDSEDKVTTTTETVVIKPRKRLPRRKIEKIHLEKKIPTMHSRQFGAKTLQMNQPIKIEESVDEEQKETATVDKLDKEGNLRVRSINRKRKINKTKGLIKEYEAAVEEGNEESEEKEIQKEVPIKRRKVVKTSKKSTKQIRKFPELYEEQWKTQVAPSVAPASEDFVDHFEGMDEEQEKTKQKRVQPQNDTPMNDAIDMRSKGPIEQLTPQQEESILDKEIHKRVLQRIRSSKTESSPEEEESKETEKTEEVEDSDDESYEEDNEEETSVAPTTTTSTTTTTTSTPATVIRAERTRKMKKVRKTLVTRQQCLNLRSFSKQFLFDNLTDFAKEHCYFIENYYPNLTCAKREKYSEKCEKILGQED